MSKKDGMYCYYDWIAPLKKVPAEEFKALVIAMLEYSRDDTPPPEFEGGAGIIADFIFPQIARSKIYAANGARGGKISQSETASTVGSTNGSSLKHKHKQIHKTETQSPLPPPGESASFESFWSAYPKKQNKQSALKEWDKLKPDLSLAERIIAAVERAKRSADWMKEDGRFIPLPTNYLNGKRWEDEWIETELPKEGDNFETNDFFDAALRRSYGKFYGDAVAKGNGDPPTASVDELRANTEERCFSAEASCLPKEGKEN